MGLWIAQFDSGREDEPDVIRGVVVQWLNLNTSTYVAPLLVRRGTTAPQRGCVRPLVRERNIPWEAAILGGG